MFVFQKDKAPSKRAADASSGEDGEDSDREDGYCPPVKRERTSSSTQFPSSHSVASKNNVFMPSSFWQSPTGNSEDSEPEEKPVGFRLKPPTLIHGKAPSSGVPSQKPKEQLRSVLRPAMLQAPPAKTNSESTNGVKKSTDGTSEGSTIFRNNTEQSDGLARSPKCDKEEDGMRDDCPAESSFVFGQNIKDRAKLEESSKDCKLLPLASQKEGTNYFLEYIATPSSKNAANNTDKGAKFVFGQNMSERVLSPPRGGEASEEDCKDLPAPPVSEPSSKENTPEKGNNVTESLEESAAAYTKATAKKCILEKVDVKTGEESESNVLQVGQLAAALHHRILALKSRADQEPHEASATDCVPEADLPHSEGDSDEEDQVNNTAAGNSEGGETLAAGNT
ncbi:unnamed protein product [Oncorhynchus mykiss]|uniref:RanBD1 domain-containing protein n=1 Tax=Oncorhynchus mykiss TaxID=8022 RepID=A0A060YBV4_ONCMY|nr:unnamed protein product [Oncorhynchus mykiss]